MKRVKNILPFIAFILFIGNYHICEYFYSDDIKNWWHLKVDIYCLIIAILFTYVSIGKKGWVAFWMYILTGLTVANAVDRFLFDIRVFTKKDIIMILLTVAYATYDLIKWQRQTKTY